MRVEELRRVIEGPAQQGDWSFEPGLVDLLLYGGIHYRMSIENGVAQGQCIGRTVLDRVHTLRSL
jgi:hypothetical protein